MWMKKIEFGYYYREIIQEITSKTNETWVKEITQLQETEEEVTKITKVYYFELDDKQVEKIKQRCILIQFPMTEYYDYLLDVKNSTLTIDLKQQTSNSIRGYQSICLSKVFGSGRARSGIIVLPCGSGKTLIGIVATSTIKKSTLIICLNNVSVSQWYSQFIMWSTIDPKYLLQWTSEKKLMSYLKLMKLIFYLQHIQ